MPPEHLVSLVCRCCFSTANDIERSLATRSRAEDRIGIVSTQAACHNSHLSRLGLLVIELTNHGLFAVEASI